MTKYFFEGNSPINEVEVVHTAGGGVRAYLRARENADPAALEHLKNVLTFQSIKWTPMMHEDRPALEVRSIGRNGKKLLELLTEEGAVSGPMRAEKNPENRISWWEKFRHNTLRWSGIPYEIGDAGFVAYGIIDWTKGEKMSWQNLAAGIFYACGTPFLWMFGKGDKSDIQIRHISYDIMQHLKDKGINTPDDASIRSMTYRHNSTLPRRIKSWMERYPAEISNSFYGLAGSMIVWDSIKHFFKYRKETAAHIDHSKPLSAILTDIGLGALSFIAAPISVFVEEETPNPDEPKKTGAARVWQWIKEKPLRTAGLLLGAATACHAYSTARTFWTTERIIQGKSPGDIKDAKKDREALFGRGLFVTTNLMAEAMMTLSSKGHGEGVKSDSSLEPSTYAVMADLLRRSAPENQERVLDVICDHLSDKENLNEDKNIIRQKIILQMREMDKNPWAGRNPPAEMKTMPSMETNAHQQEAKWQSMVAQQPELAATSPAF